MKALGLSGCLLLIAAASASAFAPAMASEPDNTPSQLSTTIGFIVDVGTLRNNHGGGRGGGGGGADKEEFVGPFANWKNAKIDYGAVGNGVADDTAALQNCLTALNETTVPVCYVPAGTYLISNTLPLAAVQYVGFIGEDPSTTKVLFKAGATPVAMVSLNGVAYSRINRLTFDGNNTATRGVRQAWDGTTGFFDTGNQLADDAFVNFTEAGYACGTLGNGCAETSLLRDRFASNVAGISIFNFNALDVWCWYCTFSNNGTGATNVNGAGNFHILNSIFSGSTVADISLGNTGIMTFSNNYSSGSNQFINCGGSSNPNNLSVQGNTVVNTSSPNAIYCNDYGPVVLIDNKISASGSTAPVVNVGQDLFSAGNTYTVGTAACASAIAASRCHSIGDQVVGSITASPPALPGTPPNLHRTIYEASPSGSGTTCSVAFPCSVTQAIANAAAGCANNVAHIQDGAHLVTASIIVPANCPVQIVGDGGGSIIRSNAPIGAVLRLVGPSKATVNELVVDALTGNPSAIVVDKADQPGSRVFGEGVNNRAASNANLRVAGLDRTNVEMHDYLDDQSLINGVEVMGGASAAAGTWLGGATNIFAGAGNGSDPTQFAMTRNAHLSARQFWHDSGGGSGRLFGLSGTGGAFSIFGMAGYSGASDPQLSLAGFSGSSALLNINTTGNVGISGAGGGANNLVLGLISSGSVTPFSDTTSPADTFGFLNSQSKFSVTGSVNAVTAAGSNVLHFAANPLGLAVGEFVADQTAPAVIPAGTTISSINGVANTVTLSANVAGAGVGGADSIQFSAADPACCGSATVSESGVSTLGFVNTALTQLRAAQPTVPNQLAAGVTDARFYRVSTSKGTYGLRLEPNEDFFTDIRSDRGSGSATVNYNNGGDPYCGSPDPKRIVVVAAGARISSSASISSVTIGGIAATEASGAFVQSNSVIQGDIWYASVPTGTTCSVTVTWAVAPSDNAVALYRVITTTPAPTAVQNSAAATGVNPTPITYTVPSNGVGINLYFQRNSLGPGEVAWTNAVTDVNALIGRDVGLSHVSVAGSVTVGATDPAISGGSSESVLVGAVWGP